MEFLERLGVNILIILLLGGFFYWIRFFINKVAPDLKYEIRYKIFNKKYNEEEVKRLLEYLDKGMSKNEVYKFLLVSGITSKKAGEMKYIYSQLLKGGNK